VSCNQLIVVVVLPSPSQSFWHCFCFSCFVLFEWALCIMAFNNQQAPLRRYVLPKILLIGKTSPFLLFYCCWAAMSKHNFLRYCLFFLLLICGCKSFLLGGSSYVSQFYWGGVPHIRFSCLSYIVERYAWSVGQSGTKTLELTLRNIVFIANDSDPWPFKCDI